MMFGFSIYRPVNCGLPKKEKKKKIVVWYIFYHQKTHTPNEKVMATRKDKLADTLVFDDSN